MNFSGQNREFTIPGRVTTKSEQMGFITCSSIRSLGNVVPRRPILGIEVLEIQGKGLIDTTAKGTIAGSSLYVLLLQDNQPFTSSSMRVKLADDSASTRAMLTTTLDVVIKDKRITVDFHLFPDKIDNDILLGIDFLTAAGLEIILLLPPGAFMVVGSYTR